jgi:hypothetical protein
MNDSAQDVLIGAFKDMGFCPGRLVRTFALSEGRVVAQKFFYEGGYAVWAAGAISFYDEDGRLLRSLRFGAAKSDVAA